VRRARSLRWRLTLATMLMFVLGLATSVFLIELQGRLTALERELLALANRTARIVWALMARGGVYRSPASATSASA
jgi:hypothetical protein